MFFTAFEERDPAVQALTATRLREEVTEYMSLLNARVREGVVHDFLAERSYFFNGILRLFGYSPLNSKVKLGHDYEVDFAWFDSGSYRSEWRLVEIESPTRTMFTKAGNPSESLTHAVQQVRDWHDWVHDHLDYARGLMPFIDYPLGYVFIGRRRDLTDATWKELKRLRFEHRMFLEIHTLDWFGRNAESVVNLIHPTDGGEWPIPARAFGHADLKRQLPEHSFDWLHHRRNQELLKERRRDRITERRYGYMGSDEFWEEPPELRRLPRADSFP